MDGVFPLTNSSMRMSAVFVVCGYCMVYACNKVIMS